MGQNPLQHRQGNLYLSGTGYEDRLNLIPLHSEPDGVIVALNCFELHDEHLLPENVDFCDALNVTASRHDYEHLMNTTFGLVPAGRSPATYRLAEVMSAGAIPVFVAREYVRPFPERVDWPSFSFMFPPEEIGASMMATLRNVDPKELWEMQVRVWEIMHGMFRVWFCWGSPANGMWYTCVLYLNMLRIAGARKGEHLSGAVGPPCEHRRFCVYHPRF